MLYRVNFTCYAFKLLPALHPDTKKLIRDSLEELKKNPFLGKNLQQDIAGFQSFRLRRYRIIYRTDIKTRTITVYFVGHRRNVYESFAEIMSR